MERSGFWLLALAWLPTGIVVTAVVRFMPGMWQTAEPGLWVPTLLMNAPSLVPVMPCGLPLALGCRRLWCLGHRRAAWAAGGALGAVSVAVSVVAGLLGLLAIAVCAAILSLPVWFAWWWLARRG